MTPRQRECLDCIESYIDEHGYSPSYVEIAGMLGIASRAAVHRHIAALKRRGFIRAGYGQARSIEIVEDAPLRRAALDLINARQAANINENHWRRLERAAHAAS